MKRIRTTRAKASVVAGFMLLSGLGVVGTATPAAAASWCNTTQGDFVSGGDHSLAQIPAYNANRDCITARGASGSHVKAIQRSLRYCHGRSSVAVDGHFGEITETQLEIVQRALGLDDDGVYGPKTRDKLRWRAGDGVCGTLP
ncbi:peptidoglycan-binding protein [Streptomyces phaeochromogenes]|uniref:Peptidoglycan-binding protein n=1 Tax=Streptomyces phaeochromogenes TaxID=1923 RepID=A0ABZ1HDB5_STRPH|nr:peptidoglycan-binding domain-containing protein [Streptomyces phaeochromogenes]MCX5603891.1 peptidoglycan-binding protein [Streptomyces phaeochromogenes]WSD15573.1 peptidoglycan-binding protein [Streptomyces phaeochromogenes]